MRIPRRDPFREKQDRYNYTNPWYTRVTTLGAIVGAVVLLALIVLFTYATRNVCWIGDGYGPCF